ncbi:MAG: HYR domain-containing protein [Gaiellaceae bacterium]
MTKGLVVAAAVAVAFGVVAAVTHGAPSAAPPISIDVTSPVEATAGSGANVSYHVKSRSGLDVTCSPTGGPGQDFDASAQLPLGDSTISCTDGTETATATVTVEDTTPPSVTTPGAVTASSDSLSGTAVTYPDAIASDLVDGSLAAACTPASGSNFGLGVTTVSCDATDTHGNTGHGTFTVTVTYNDQTAPTLSVPSALSAEATSPSGAAVTYTATATDDSGASPTISCVPSSGSTFPLGATTVTCTATDAASNSSTASFAVTIQDTTPPSLSLPSNITVEADSAAGKIVTYAASATDTVSGSVSVNCTPASGSTFAIGQTMVNCTAADGAGRTADASFSVTVTDISGPEFSGVPVDRQVEANGPGGSVVSYVAPTATDATDGPAVVNCSPSSGSTIPLGTSTVTCSASDSRGNTSTTSFSVRVADTTKPNLIVPADRAVYAETPDGISAQSPNVVPFLVDAQATDTVDPRPRVTNDAPQFLTVGPHTVTFTAVDASDNSVSKTATLDVRAMPAPGTSPAPLPTPPAQTPPKDVTGLEAQAGDARVRLSWNLPNGVDHVVVTRQLSAGGDAEVVYKGSAESYTDGGLVNGIEYRYVVVSFDKIGKSSAGVAVTALPKATLLRSPKEGAKLKKPPALVWIRKSEAAYYNVQLFRGNLKILSTWPSKPRVGLRPRWKYQGHNYTLAPGVYRWYVWPGFGARAAVDYGEMLGFSSFQIVR